MAGSGTSREWDAIVVGAGIIGCAVAREVSRRGARTVVLETRDVGGGATQASAGVLAPHIEAPGEGPLHALTVDSLAMYDEFIAGVARDSGVSIEYRRCGTLEVAGDQASLTRLVALGERLRSIGIEAQWADSAGVRFVEPSLGDVLGGLLVPSHGYVRAMQLTSALVEAGRRQGVTFHAGRRVDAIGCEGEDVIATSAGETFRARTLVLAAGSWSASLAPETAVTPVRGQLVQLRWGGPPLSRVVWSEHCYVVPWLDGTVLVGATVEDVGFDKRVTLGGVQALVSAMRALLPPSADATFVGARVGLRPATPSGLPLIRRSTDHPGIVFATGHYRNGILLAPLTAHLVADLVLPGGSERES